MGCHISAAGQWWAGLGGMKAGREHDVGHQAPARAQKRRGAGESLSAAQVTVLSSDIGVRGNSPANHLAATSIR